jgi:hypothetical protein
VEDFVAPQRCRTDGYLIQMVAGGDLDFVGKGIGGVHDLSRRTPVLQFAAAIFKRFTGTGGGQCIVQRNIGGLGTDHHQIAGIDVMTH